MDRVPTLVAQLVDGGQQGVELGHHVAGDDSGPAGVLRLHDGEWHVEQQGGGRALPVAGAVEEPGPVGAAEVGGVPRQVLLFGFSKSVASRSFWSLRRSRP